MILRYRFSKPLEGVVFDHDQEIYHYYGIPDPVRCIYNALIEHIDPMNVVPAKGHVLVYNADGQIETVYYALRFSEGDTIWHAE